MSATLAITPPASPSSTVERQRARRRKIGGQAAFARGVAAHPASCMSHRHHLLIALSLLLAVITGGSARSEVPSVNREKLAGFVDGMTQAAMERDHIAGVVVAVTDKNG